MRALNKKMMTLACATCLTVGMGAVACADTVDLGYGLYGNTSPTVKAVEVMRVPTDAKLRNNEQSQIISVANKAAVDAVNTSLKLQAPVQVDPMKGDVLDGFSYYQLQGTDKQGHHVGQLVVVDYSKNAIDQVINMNKTILEKVPDAEKAKIKSSISKYVDSYSKEKAQQQLQGLKGNTIEGAKLAKDLKMLNDKLPAHIMGVVDKMLATEKNLSPKSKEELRSYVDFMAKQVSLDATHVAYKPVQTRYGTAVTGDLRGSLIYDGFRNTDSLIGYAVPTNKGVSLQILMSDDSSHDYWANELNHMYQTQSLKGGK
ncbi:hypothetical protein VEIDISOL_01960 [Veillonella dispar ATCC 17748]|uniref:Uncharacterized protein n=1 Tax=Veillonella dispar ATCC 17748 TaxID=546273 RepID=C4FSR6_9FIRM|nr:hypothetical protein [Veillonella dispar]EEP64894.1 hypothetical protein VEIDISOL_01960 [Veillonella dispar ATCC 17748]VEG92986.1 Uncharacterised protein [Veillonella dispar]